MPYNQDQVMLSLAFLSYLGFYETSFGVQASDRTFQSIAKGLKTSACLKGEWELAWGPAMYRLPLTVFDENLMFVARNTRERGRYAIVIRGTNPLSITNWLLQDFNVVVQTPWPYAGKTPGLTPKLSKGTARGLQALQDMKPNRGLPGADVRLYQFLADEIARNSSERITISVTGHSLGGALAPAVALWLADTQQRSDDPESPPWDPKRRCTIDVCSFAGPSAGNADFAAYYDQKLGASTRRIWNKYDVVPHGWITTALQNLPQLYQPIAPDLLMSAVLWSAHRLAQGGDYKHVSQDVPMAGAIVPLLKDYGAQMIYQHTAAYPQLFGLFHEIDASAHFRFDDRINDAILAARKAAPAAGGNVDSNGPVTTAVGQLAGPLRTPSQRVSALSKALHRAYRVPASIALSIVPESLALLKLSRRKSCFHGATA